LRMQTAAVRNTGSGRRLAIVGIALALALALVMALAACGGTGRVIGRCVSLPGGSPEANEYCGAGAKRQCDEAVHFAGGKPRPGSAYSQDIEACVKAGIIEEP
jgi:hypothetical protein